MEWIIKYLYFTLTCSLLHDALYLLILLPHAWTPFCPISFHLPNKGRLLGLNICQDCQIPKVLLQYKVFSEMCSVELYVESEARLSFLGEVGRYLSPQQELHSLNKVR